jgi:hypothetical protein
MGRYNKFLGRTGPLVLHYLNENIERPNVLRMFNYLSGIIFILIFFRTY